MVEQLTFGRNGGESRGDQIYKRFKIFHIENPIVWELFKRFTFEIINAGYERYSVDAVFQRIRWHIDIETKSSDGLKLNDHYRAYYARMFHAKFDIPIFEVRRLRSNDGEAYWEDISVFKDGSPDPDKELQLREELRSL